jgi:tetratricopeptide (TPR) repeat protein
MLLHSFVDFNLRITSNALVFTLLLAVTVAMTRFSRDAAQEGEWGVPLDSLLKKLGAAIVLLLIAAVILTPAAQTYAGYLASTQNDIEAAVRRDPDNAAYHHQWGVVLQHQAALKENTVQEREMLLAQARQEFETAMLLSPADYHYWASYGWLSGNLRRTEKAEQAFKTAMKLSPNIKSAQYLYGQYRKSFRRQ